MGAFLILTVVSWNLLAQAPAAAPIATFDLKLDQQIGSGASISFFVARNSHLYFVGSGSGSAALLQTDLSGTVQSSIPLDTEKVAALDADSEGSIFVLSDDSWLTIFSPDGGIRQTLHIEPKAVTFALVGGKPLFAEDTSGLRFLAADHSEFTLAAWPRPWTLLGGGRTERVTVWSPQGPTLTNLEFGDGTTTTMLGSNGKAVAAASDSDGQTYLLSAETRAGVVEVREFDEHTRPRWVGRYTLPEGFHPQMLGLTSGRIYLIDVSGRAAVYAPERAVLADSNPELLTDMDHVTEAARTAGYKGRLKILFTIGTDGVPRAISIQSPASLINDSGVISAVQALRYRPQIKNGAAVAAAMNLELGVS